MDLSKRSLGQWGEDRAAAHLRRSGLRIVDRNWRAPEREIPGELDIVAVEGATVVVCEVKTRRTGRFGGAVAAVGEAKQQRIRSLTESWLRHRPGEGREGVRFDVIAIDGVRLRHWKAAF